MSETNYTLTVVPVGTDRFDIAFIAHTAAGPVEKYRLQGPGREGYSEADLRDPMGLPKCGLTESQIDSAIASANAKRVPENS